ncbi:MAG: hypothetical protein H7210_06885 [Pyrinomonadaceae bacterium]|nr:hypothetical protein [Phycisphaerales bacterium]
MTVLQSSLASWAVLALFLILASILQGLMVRAAVRVMEVLNPWNPRREPIPTISVPVALGIGFTGTVTRLVIGATIWVGLTLYAALSKVDGSFVEPYTSYVMSRLTWLVDPIVITLMAETSLARGFVIALTTIALTLVIGIIVFGIMWMVYTPARYAFWW